MSGDISDPRFQPYNAALGRMTAMWAHLEYHINQSIWELANVERHAGACITAQIISPGQRFRTMLALLDLRGAKKELWSEFNRLFVDARLARQRNRYVHDPVGMDDTGQVLRIHVTADRRLDFGFKPAEISDLEKLYIEIKDLSGDFDRLWERALAELPPWPREQYERSPGIRAYRQDRNSTPRVYARLDHLGGDINLNIGRASLGGSPRRVRF